MEFDRFFCANCNRELASQPVRGLCQTCTAVLGSRPAGMSRQFREMLAGNQAPWRVCEDFEPGREDVSEWVIRDATFSVVKNCHADYSFAANVCEAVNAYAGGSR